MSAFDFSKWFSEKRLLRLLTGVSLVAIIFGCASLFRAPGRFDECWYYYLVQHQACEGFSFFPLYLAPIKDWTFVPMRTFFLISKWLVATLFLFSVWNLLRKKWRLHNLDLLAMILLSTVFCSSTNMPSYVSLNFLFFVAAMTAVVAALRLVEEKGFASIVLASLGGLLGVQVVFIMPPNAIILPVVAVGLYVCKKRLSLAFCIGAVLGIAAFLIIVCPWPRFLQFAHHFMDLTGDQTDGHTFGLLINWSIRTGVALFPSLTIGVFLSKLLVGQNWRKSRALVAFNLCVVMFFLALTVCLRGLWLLNIYWVSALVVGGAWLEVSRSSIVDRKILVAFILSFLAPLCLNFGSNVGFGVRGCSYAPFLVVWFWAFLRRHDSELMRCTLLLWLFLACYAFGSSVWQKSWSTGTRWCDEVRSLAEYGTHARMAQEQYDELCKIKELSAKAKYMYGGYWTWDLVVLLGKESLSSIPGTDTCDLTSMIVNRQIGKLDLILIEDKGNFEINEAEERELLHILSADGIRRCPLSNTRFVVSFE